MCFAKRKADELVKNWQGQYRCKEHDEPRHPQDFLKAIPDNPSVPYVQDPSFSFAFDVILLEDSYSTPFVGEDIMLTEDNNPILMDG